MDFSETFIVDFNRVVVVKCSNTAKYSAIFTSGISVTIGKVDDILDMMLLVPPIFKGTVYRIIFALRQAWRVLSFNSAKVSSEKVV